LIGEVARRRSVGDKGELEVMDDSIHHGLSYLKKIRSILGMVKRTRRWGTSRRSSSCIHSPHCSSLLA